MFFRIFYASLYGVGEFCFQEPKDRYLGKSDFHILQDLFVRFNGQAADYERDVNVQQYYKAGHPSISTGFEVEMDGRRYECLSSGWGRLVNNN